LIAFVGVDDRDVHVINSDGTGAKRLSAVPAAFPHWSSDGTKLVFTKYESCDPLTCAVPYEVMNANGSGLRMLTQGPWGGVASWSPDGQKLVLGSLVQPPLIVLDANGSGRRTLTSADGGWPAWSPDGKEIVFGGQTQLYVVAVNSTHARTLTRTPGEKLAPDWSPDGKRIVFEGTPSPNASDIYVMNADGTGIKRLTHSGDDGDPSWSPDGTKIVYDTQPSNYKNQIFIMNADGSHQTHLTSGYEPDWQPVPR
jgi:TolB protein